MCHCPVCVYLNTTCGGSAAKYERSYGKLNNTLHAGSYFGEIGLFTGERRSASVVSAASFGIVLAFDDKSFRSIFRKLPSFTADVKLRLTEFEPHLQDIIQHPGGFNLFVDYLRTEYSTENVHFLKAFGSYKLLWEKLLHDLKRRALSGDPFYGHKHVDYVRSPSPIPDRSKHEPSNLMFPRNGRGRRRSSAVVAKDLYLAVGSCMTDSGDEDAGDVLHEGEERDIHSAEGCPSTEQTASASPDQDSASPSQDTASEVLINFKMLQHIYNTAYFIFQEFIIEDAPMQV